MVKLKMLIFFMTLLSLSSCMRWYNTTEGGFWPKKPNFKLDAKKKHNREGIISTSAIYELYTTFHGEDTFYSPKEVAYRGRKKLQNYEYRSYLRFYKNGNLSAYAIHKDSIIGKNSFNPKEGIIGVYFIDDSTFHIEEFGYVRGSGMYIKSKAQINKDTLYVIEKIYNQIKHELYVKREVPKAWLDWNADW